MNEETVVREQTVRVVGVSAGIEKESAQADIGALWHRAAEAGLLEAGKPTYGVYYDYEDRLANRYRVLVGQASDAQPGPGQEAVTLPAGSYHRAQLHGDGVDCAVRLWKSVWARREPLPRSFTIDFERYDGPPEDADVSLFIALD